MKKKFMDKYLKPKLYSQIQVADDQSLEKYTVILNKDKHAVFAMLIMIANQR